MTKPKTKVAIYEAPAVESEGASLVRLAIEKNLDVDKLERLVALKVDEDKRRAERAFFEAMAEFQKRCPLIDKGKTVDYVTRSGVRVHYKHAELKHIQRAIGPICADLGFSYYWTHEERDGKLTETCILSHIAGHSRSSSFTIPIANNNPGMSDQQKPAAAQTFAQRYSLIAVFGLITSDPDTDAEEAGGGETVTQDQADTLRALAEEVGVKVERILKAAKVERLEDVKASQYGRYVQMLEAKRSAA